LCTCILHLISLLCQGISLESWINNNHPLKSLLLVAQQSLYLLDVQMQIQTVHRVLCTAHCTVHHCAMCTVHCALYTVVYSAGFALYTVYSSLYSTVLHSCTMYTTLHGTALHCTALHSCAMYTAMYTALHCTALHCTAQLCNVHCTALHCTALHCTALHCTALHCTALHCTALHCTALHCALRTVWRVWRMRGRLRNWILSIRATPPRYWACCTALHCAALHCTALHCTALHYTALHCTALHCTALHCTEVASTLHDQIIRTFSHFTAPRMVLLCTARALSTPSHAESFAHLQIRYIEIFHIWLDVQGCHPDTHSTQLLIYNVSVPCLHLTNILKMHTSHCIGCTCSPRPARARRPFSRN
jgi:hypothetical protein